jgi:hypothetical protein
MNSLRVYAKRLDSNEKLIGTGINIFDDNAILYDKYASYQVDPETVVLRRNNVIEKYENPQTTDKLAYELHNKLVQTIIDFMNEHDIKDIDEISFGADSLQISKAYHKWTPATDSSLTLYGYQGGKKKEINSSN